MIIDPKFWSSPNFSVPPPQWTTWEPTRLEALALRAGVDSDELRELLYVEIERRRLGGDDHETSRLDLAERVDGGSVQINDVDDAVDVGSGGSEIAHENGRGNVN